MNYLIQRQTLRLVLLLVIFSFLLNGCATYHRLFGGKDNTEPPAPLVEFTSTVRVASVWRARAGSGTGGTYLKLVPAVAADLVAVADAAGRVYAYDRESGNLRWSANIDSKISSGPGIGDGIVVVGTSDARVFALDQATGQVVWIALANNQILSPPTIEQGIVLVKSVDDQVIALDSYDGSELWNYQKPTPSLILHSGSAPRVAHNIAVVGFADGSVSAFKLDDGEIIWEEELTQPSGATEVERMVDIDADPIISRGIVYVVSYQGNLAAYTLATGEQLWQQEVSSYAGLALSDDSIFVSDTDSYLWAYDRDNGNVMWVQQALRARRISAPAILEDSVVVGDTEGYLHFISVDNGQFLARTRVDNSAIIAQPVSYDGHLYVLTEDGHLADYVIL